MNPRGPARRYVEALRKVRPGRLKIFKFARTSAGTKTTGARPTVRKSSGREKSTLKGDPCAGKRRRRKMGRRVGPLRRMSLPIPRSSTGRPANSGRAANREEERSVTRSLLRGSSTLLLEMTIRQGIRPLEPDGIGGASTRPLNTGGRTTGCARAPTSYGCVGVSEEAGGGPPAGCFPPHAVYGT